MEKEGAARSTSSRKRALEVEIGSMNVSEAERVSCVEMKSRWDENVEIRTTDV